MWRRRTQAEALVGVLALGCGGREDRIGLGEQPLAQGRHERGVGNRLGDGAQRAHEVEQVGVLGQARATRRVVLDELVEPLSAARRDHDGPRCWWW